MHFIKQAIPFIYVLMSRKSERCYVHLFQTLQQMFPLNGHSVMTDFELAMRNAIRTVYPHIKLYTCWFHFCQAAKRKASQLMNLVHHMKSNANIRNAYYKLLALPLLPASEIIACFQMIKSQVADEKVFKPFLRYFERQWIKKVISFIFFFIWNFINCFVVGGSGQHFCVQAHNANDGFAWSAKWGSWKTPYEARSFFQVRQLFVALRIH